MSLFLHIGNMLESPFQKIENIVERAQNPFVVRQAIAERFALIIPETMQEYLSNKINKAKRTSRPTSKSSSPISTTSTTPNRSPETSPSRNPISHNRSSLRNIPM